MSSSSSQDNFELIVGFPPSCCRRTLPEWIHPKEYPPWVWVLAESDGGKLVVMASGMLLNSPVCWFFHVRESRVIFSFEC
jgi:hypothetical protein